MHSLHASYKLKKTNPFTKNVYFFSPSPLLSHLKVSNFFNSCFEASDSQPKSKTFDSITQHEYQNIIDVKT